MEANEYIDRKNSKKKENGLIRWKPMRKIRKKKSIKKIIQSKMIK